MANDNDGKNDEDVPETLLQSAEEQSATPPIGNSDDGELVRNAVDPLEKEKEEEERDDKYLSIMDDYDRS